MKVIKTLIAYILSTTLAIMITAVLVIHVISSHVLNKNYILSELDEQNYYDEIYENVKSNFENYIYQSGLNEDVLDDIVSKEKIENDTKIIINNIYDGVEEKIETQTIHDKLEQKITESLGGTIPNSQKASIEEYISTICDEYKNTITSTKYDTEINQYITKANQYKKLANKVLLISIGVILILLCIFSIKEFHKILSKIGVASITSGSILLYIKYYVFSKVRIGKITILNEAISKVLRAVLISIFGEICKYGYILLIIGLLFIVIYSIINVKEQQKDEKEKYTSENE